MLSDGTRRNQSKEEIGGVLTAFDKIMEEQGGGKKPFFEKSFYKRLTESQLRDVLFKELSSSIKGRFSGIFDD